MYGYTIIQWLMFFYIYCFIGWCWETLYVSIRKRKFTNRGFMVGPWLPIYGSGAIIMLLAALPFKDNIFLVFICGMIAATILEYCTGVIIEALFKVRYWDYSNQPLNLNGHICFFCSLGWGVASVLLVKFLHSPVEAFVLKIDYTVLRWIVTILSIIIAVDFALSFRAAMDLKSVLENLTQSNEEIRKLKKRLDVLIAVIDDERLQLIKKYDEKLNQTKSQYREFYENIRQKFSVIDQIKISRDRVNSFPEEDVSKEYEKIKMRFGFIDEMKNERKSHINIWIRRIVKGNPTIRSEKYAAAAEELKDIISKKRKAGEKTLAAAGQIEKEEHADNEQGMNERRAESND